MAVRTLKELYKERIELDSDDIWLNGYDNAYPERIERVIDNSPTASMAAENMADFIYGKGFENEELSKTIINKKKNLTFNKILRLISNEISYQKGFFLHVNYDVDGNPIYLDVLPFKNCRITKEDDDGNPSEIVYSKKWESDGKKVFFEKTKKDNDKKWFFPFSYDKETTIIRFKNNANIALNEDENAIEVDFRGEVLYVNLDHRHIYPKAYIDSAYADANNEFRNTEQLNNQLRNGFVNKTLIVAQEDESTLIYDNENESKFEQYHNHKGKENDDIEGALVDLMGSDGANVSLHKVSNTDDIDKVIKKIDLSPEIDVDIIKAIDERSENNILKSFKNQPKGLVKSNEGLFANGSEALKEMQKYYYNNLEYERNSIIEAFEMIFNGKEMDFSLIPYIDIEDDNITTENETQLQDV